MRTPRLSCWFAALIFGCLIGGGIGCGPADPAADPADGSDPAATEGSAAEAEAAPDAIEPGSPVDELRSAVAALAARKEHGSNYVQVQHVLIAVTGAPRMQIERSPEEAERLAADIFRQAQDGVPFNQLLIHGEDPGGSEYRIIRPQRLQYAKGFGDVAWRLYPGEIGVCPYDPEDSPFGYHIMYRIL